MLLDLDNGGTLTIYLEGKPCGMIAKGLVGPLLPCISCYGKRKVVKIHGGIRFLAVRADLEADVALDFVLALGRRFRGGWPVAHRSPFQDTMKMELLYSRKMRKECLSDIWILNVLALAVAVIKAQSLDEPTN